MLFDACYARLAALLLLISLQSAGVAAEGAGAPPVSAETRIRQQLVQVALAREPADLILRGATLPSNSFVPWAT